MPIGAIISQPTANSIHAAYRPVVMRVSATRTDNMPRPPVVYCDIYFNDVYYKTLAKTQYSVLEIANSEWQFDIQDAAQEYLRKFLGENGESAIVEATPIIVKTFCRFRSSGFDVNGFTTQEGTPPVQGTSSSDPVSGTGTQTSDFYILNVTLKHADNQDLATHLASFKKRTWANKTYPLTHRPEYYRICLSDSDVFPIVHDGNELSCLVLKYQNLGQSTWNTVSNCTVLSCPIPDNVTFSVLDNEDGTQTFTVNWGVIPSPTAQLNIQYRIAGSSDAWTDNIGSIIAPRSIELPIGLYDFRVLGVGDCNSKAGPVYSNQGIAICVPVDMLSAGNNLPNAQAGIPYSYTIYLSGTAPFALANVVKPAWMTIAIVGSQVQITGTPTNDDAGEDVEVSFDITNCGGGSSVSAGSSIDVTATTGSLVTNNSDQVIRVNVIINGLSVMFGEAIDPGQSAEFSAPELDLGEGYELKVYTASFLMTTCTAVSNSVNIPMAIDTSGPGTNNQAQNTGVFAIVDGVQIAIN